MPVLNRLFHRIKVAFLKVLMSDRVRPFLWLYYVPLWLWGAMGTFFTAPATVVKPVMGQTVYDMWIWLCLMGTSIAMCGFLLEGRSLREDVVQEGDLTIPLNRLGRVSIQLQAGGHACMFFVLLAFEVAASYAIPFGDGMTFTVFVIAPYVAGCLLLAVQSVAKWVVAERNRGGP